MRCTERPLASGAQQCLDRSSLIHCSITVSDSIERQLRSIARLFDIALEVSWRSQPSGGQPRLVMDEGLQKKTGPA